MKKLDAYTNIDARDYFGFISWMGLWHMFYAAYPKQSGNIVLRINYGEMLTKKYPDQWIAYKTAIRLGTYMP